MKALPTLVAITVLMAVSAAAQTGGTIGWWTATPSARGGITYRLVGFDTPATGDRARCAAERILGENAKARLQALINSGGPELTEVRCSCPPGTCGTRFCNYGRSCATLEVRGVDVGTTLIAEGLARRLVCWKYQCPMRRP